MPDPTPVLEEIRDRLGSLPQAIADVLRETPRQTLLGGSPGGPPDARGAAAPESAQAPAGGVAGIGAALAYSGLGQDQQLGLLRMAGHAQEAPAASPGRGDVAEVPPAVYSPQPGRPGLGEYTPPMPPPPRPWWESEPIEGVPVHPENPEGHYGGGYDLSQSPADRARAKVAPDADAETSRRQTTSKLLGDDNPPPGRPAPLGGEGAAEVAEGQSVDDNTEAVKRLTEVIREMTAKIAYGAGSSEGRGEAPGKAPKVGAGHGGPQSQARKGGAGPSVGG